MDEDSRNLCVMPLFHIAGSGWALFGMANGAVTVMMREFDPVAGLSHGWKMTPRLKFFGAEYLGPSMVLRRTGR